MSIFDTYIETTSVEILTDFGNTLTLSSINIDRMFNMYLPLYGYDSEKMCYMKGVTPESIIRDRVKEQILLLQDVLEKL